MECFDFNFTETVYRILVYSAFNKILSLLWYPLESNVRSCKNLGFKGAE